MGIIKIKIRRNDLKTNIKVKVMMLKPEERVKEKYNRAKIKQEVRRMAEDYVERQESDNK